MRNLLRRLGFDADTAAAAVGGHLPEASLRVLLRQTLRGHQLALCLHRVAPRARATDWQPGLNIDPAELDALIDLLLCAAPASATGFLTVTFDDGYDDAARYVAERAPRWPQVAFLFFVCPQKVEARAGFRWDEVEESVRSGQPLATARALLDAPVSLAEENARPQLRRLAALPDYQLATLEALRALAAIPNVELGNHTNLHLSARGHDPALIAADYRQSTADFERLFGTQRHFAFPYGTPGHHFSAAQVAALRALGNFTVWTTQARPSLAAERRPGAVLPRYPVDGLRDHRQLAGWIAARAVDLKLRGPRYHYP